MFPQELSESPCQQSQVDDRWPRVREEMVTLHHDMLSFVLGVRTLAGLQGERNAGVVICKRRAANVSKGFSKHSLVLPTTRKQDNVCKKERHTAEKREICNPSHVGRGQYAAIT